MHNDLLDKRRRAWSQENVTKPISTDAKHELRVLKNVQKVQEVQSFHLQLFTF